MLNWDWKKLFTPLIELNLCFVLLQWLHLRLVAPRRRSLSTTAVLVSRRLPRWITRYIATPPSRRTRMKWRSSHPPSNFGPRTIPSTTLSREKRTSVSGDGSARRRPSHKWCPTGRNWPFPRNRWPCPGPNRIPGFEPWSPERLRVPSPRRGYCGMCS